MWENSTEKQTAPLYQSKTVSKKEKLKKTDLLLAAQVLVCLAAVALAFFLRSIQISFWPELCDAYNTVARHEKHKKFSSKIQKRAAI